MLQQTLPLWFVFHDKKLLLLPETGGDQALPCGEAPPFAAPCEQRVHNLGLYNGAPCYACALQTLPPDAEQHWSLTELRASYTILGEELYLLAGKGAELIHWDNNTRFCPACGGVTVLKLPISKQCTVCGNELFPHIAVATITLIRRDDTLLLVRARAFRGTHYGLVAGFLEPGETLEECVTREIREETGLSVKNIRYFGSQPWPYPSGLMVGFIADYAGGELHIQQEELFTAAFFRRDGLPDLPAKLSIARRLIDSWIAEQDAMRR